MRALAWSSRRKSTLELTRGIVVEYTQAFHFASVPISNVIFLLSKYASIVSQSDASYEVRNVTCTRNACRPLYDTRFFNSFILSIKPSRLWATFISEPSQSTESNASC